MANSQLSNQIEKTGMEKNSLGSSDNTQSWSEFKTVGTSERPSSYLRHYLLSIPPLVLIYLSFLNLPLLIDHVSLEDM